MKNYWFGNDVKSYYDKQWHGFSPVDLSVMRQNAINIKLYLGKRKKYFEISKGK